MSARGGATAVRPGAEHPVELGVEFGFRAGVLRQQVPGPGESVGDGLVAGEKDGEDFVANLGVIHAIFADGVFVDFVTRGDEHGEEVATVLIGVLLHLFAASRDHAGDDGVEASAGAAELHNAGDGEVEKALEHGERDEKVVETHDGVGLGIDGEDVGGDFGVEEGARDDAERELHNAGVDVDGLPGLPDGGFRGGDGGDLIRVGEIR